METYHIETSRAKNYQVPYEAEWISVMFEGEASQRILADWFNQSVLVKDVLITSTSVIVVIDATRERDSLNVLLQQLTNFMRIHNIVCVLATYRSTCNTSISTPSEIVTAPLPHSMKGYELYSWPENSQWSFTLVTGTNRVKSLEEIISSENTVTSDGWVRVSVKDVDSIKNILKELPQHEEIFWVGKEWLKQAQIQANQIIQPSQEIMEDIQEYCKQLGLRFFIAL